MKHDDLSDLSALWQSSAPTLKLDIAAAQRRYRWQRWLMRFNAVVELLAMLLASGITLWSFGADLPLVPAIWIPLLTVWGWVLFIPLNRSRWRSFNLMKSKSLHDSLQDHIRLTEQEIFRWRVSLVGTMVLVLMQLGLITARVLTQPYSTNIDLLTDGLVIVALLTLCLWFRQRQHASERLLHSLSS